ncbi:MAG TPA: MlaD family protein [Stellaceae bacterium]|nr:MlaD family protein [Stellaceae bacterium]
METRAPYVVVGSFVLLLVAGLVVAVLWFAQVQFREKLSYYDIYFDGSVTGLTPGSTVRYSGIPVGRVAEFKLDPVDPNRVRVTIELESGTPIKTDTVASLEQQGLAGGIYVNLTGGSRDAPVVARQPDQRYPVIASRPSGLQRVVTDAPEALARLIALADQLGDILNPQNRQALGETFENLRRVTATAASHSGDIDSALADSAQTMHELRGTIEQANAILESFKTLIGPQGNVQAAAQSVNDASRKFAELAQRLNTVVAENEPQLRDFSHGGLGQLQQLVQQTQQLVAQLSRIAESVERDPSRFLYGDRREGYRPK